MKFIKRSFYLITLILGIFVLASCSKEVYKVRFLEDNNQIFLTVEVTLNDVVAEPEVNPEKEGFTFIGWYLNNEPYNFNDKVTKNLYLTPLFEVKTFSVTFLEIDLSLKVNYNDVVLKPNDPFKENHMFVGWYLDGNLYDFNTKIKTDITLEPMFVLEEPEVIDYVKVTFFQTHNYEEEIVEIVKGSKINEPETPFREGYNFIGWTYLDSFYNFDLPVNSDITLIAVWEKIIVIPEYIVMFNSSGANYNPEPLVVKENTYINEPEKPVKDGHLFIGWYKDEELVYFPLLVNDDYLLTAYFVDLSMTKTTIEDFKVLENNEQALIKGIITSFSLYNYVIIEDETGAVVVKIEGYNYNQLLNLGYEVGNELTLYATKTQNSKHIIAETKINLIVNDELIHELPYSVHIDGMNINDLKSLSGRLVSHDSLVVSSVKEEYNSIIITLKDEDLTIDLVYDTRYIISGYSSLLNYKVYDIVKIKNINVISETNPYLTINNLNQIEKIGELIVPLDETLFKVFYLNDTHGAVFNTPSMGELGLSRIGNFIKNSKDENSIFLTGGDIFQGQLISNYSKGAVIVEILNNLELDAFVIGNHEFDWGIDVILEYFNENTEGVKANFPFLGANVKRKIDDQRPEFLDAYTIINRAGYNIGIIGVMGDSLEGSIARMRVDDYYFSDAYTAVNETVNEIKEMVDFIIVVNHHSNQTFNNNVSKLDKVMAVFNGHTHSPEQGYTTNGIPYLRSGSDGKYVGLVELLINRENGINLVNSSITNYSYHQYLNSEDSEINFIIDTYYNEISYLYEDVLINTSRVLSVNDLAYFIAELMAKSTNSHFGLQNSGGTRSTISQGAVTGSDIFKVFPFDNRIITVEILGRDLKTIIGRETYTYLDINYNSINDYQYYKIATNDYVFYSNFNRTIFEPKYNEAIIGDDLYEVLYDYIYRLKENGHTYFDTRDGVIEVYSNMFSYEYYNKDNNLYLN